MTFSFKYPARAGAGLLLGTCLATGAWAQGGAIDLGTIVLTTDRIGRTVLNVAANTTVIDEDDLNDHAANDMQELVRYVPGVEVDRHTSGTDAFSNFIGFTIRGVGGNRVAIQVDGSRTAERIIDGTRDYLDFNFTKQVEIHRGPASVQWGSDALGGLVAVETKDPADLLKGKDKAVKFSFGYDSYNDATKGSVEFARKLSNNLELFVGLSRKDSHEPTLSNARDDGGIYGCPRNISYGATPCGSFDPMSTQSSRGLVKLVWTPNDMHRFEFSADVLRRNSHVQQNSVLGPVYSSFSGAATGEVIHNKDRYLTLTRQRYGIEHTYTPSGGVISQVRSRLSYTPHEYDRWGTESNTSSGGDSMFERDELKFSEDFIDLDIQATANFTTGGAKHKVVFGFDGGFATTDYFRRDVVTNITTGAVTEQRAGGFNFANADTTRADIYIEDQITFAGGKLEITPGLRFATYRIEPRPDADYRPVVGKEPATRKDEALLKSLGMIYRINDNWSVWGKYGEGFKMPTAQQLFTSSPGFYNLIPAPDLRPEEVKSYELGMRFQNASGFFAINGFKADYSDFIQPFYFVPGTNDITYRNISVVNIWGVEASGGWSLGENTQLGFTAAWQKGTQQSTPTSAKNPHTLPPLTATVSLKRAFPDQKLTLEGVATMAGDVRETTGANDFKPQGYAILDLYAKWQVVEGGFLNIGVQNVFDKRYFTAGAASYGSTASSSVARTNPIELRTGPGRVFSVSFDMEF